METDNAKGKPFFSQRLIPCAPDGEYSDFTFRRRVTLDRDGIHLGKTLIDPAYVEEVLSYGPVLKVRYGTSAGTPAESYFLYRTFLSKKAARALRAAVATATASWSGRRGSALRSVPVSAPSITVTHTEAETRRTGQRIHVTLASAKAAFPPVCPVCVGSVAHVAALHVSAGGNERGMWLVPVCGAHDILDAIRLERWRANATEIAFSFSNADYARQFCRINDRRDQPPRWHESAARLELAQGLRFVTYSYVVSAVYVSVVLHSRVFALGNAQSRLLPGLRYSLLTLCTGWWALPGLFLSIGAIIRNCRGGLDVTDRAMRALAGEPVTAYGVG